MPCCRFEHDERDGEWMETRRCVLVDTLGGAVLFGLISGSLPLDELVEKKVDSLDSKTDHVFITLTVLKVADSSSGDPALDETSRLGLRSS